MEKQEFELLGLLSHWLFAILFSLCQSDPLGLNATPLPQDSSLVETPPVENKPRKRQLSEEQPSGNGVKKPKVSGTPRT